MVCITFLDFDLLFISWMCIQVFIVYGEFQGKDSSDEEDLLDVPDDDQYDTEDSFIDDAELVGIIVIILVCV